LTLVLLIAAGLMIKSFGKLTKVDPGFTPQNLLVFDVGLPPATNDARNLSFYQQVIERIEALPGVARVGAVSRLPFSGGNSGRSFNLPGSDKAYDADIRISTPDYFRTLNIPLLRGRVFTEHDTKDSVRVAVINDAAARMLFAGEDPIGKYIENFGQNNEKLQIVGVVGNIRHLALETAPRAELYQPLGQGRWPRMFIAVRAVTGNPLVLLPAVQNAVWSVDRNVALGSVRSMEGTIARSLLKRKFTMALLTIFAGLAVALASIGLYGVMSYSVSQRTREIGIRMALGAQRTDVLRLVVRQGMLLTTMGVGLGLAGSLGLTRLISSLLFGVSATDIGNIWRSLDSAAHDRISRLLAAGATREQRRPDGGIARGVVVATPLCRRFQAPIASTRHYRDRRRRYNLYRLTSADEVPIEVPVDGDVEIRHARRRAAIWARDTSRV